MNRWFSFSFSVILCLGASVPAKAAGVLNIQVVNGYNLIVDSNVTAPPTYAPRSAYIGAQFCNIGDAPLTNVTANVGNYDAGRSFVVTTTAGSKTVTSAGLFTASDGGLRISGTGIPAGSTITSFINASTVTISQAATAAGSPTATLSSAAGIFPVKTFGADALRPQLANTGDYSLTLEVGSAGNLEDASRYVGTLAAGECRIQYWLFSYPACVNVGTPRVPQEPPCDVSNTGGVKPEDDLILDYDLWATADAVATASVTRNFTMRNEISAAANKIWPNTTSKVPPEYLAAIQSVIGWGTLGPDGQPLTSSTAVYPGQRVITTQGIWYDLGNVVHGFDNNGDLIPDQNAWLQPVGDPGSFDAACFRMVNIYGIVIVKLKTGGELLIPMQNLLYHENLPDNTGVVGLVYYQYIATKEGCAANMTPYQEAASGFDNEKFSADYGLNLGLQSGTFGTDLSFTKTDGVSSIAPGGTLGYVVTAVNKTGVPLGAPDLGTPLVIRETIPTGATFVAGSATDNFGGVGVNLTEPSGTGSYTQGYTDVSGNLDSCTINYQISSSNYIVFYSTNNGATWTQTEPAAASVTDLRWLLQSTIALDGGHNGADCLSNNGVYDNGTLQTSLPGNLPKATPGTPATGVVRFRVTVNAAGTTSPLICNTARFGFGPAESNVKAEDCTLVTGPNRISGVAFEDDGGTGGTHGNGLIDNVTEVGIGSGAIVNLYYDKNADGKLDSADLLYASSATSATRSFNLGTTNTSTTVTSAGAFLATDVGSRIYGAGIPAGAYITAFTNVNTVTISTAATATATVAGTLTGGAYSFNNLPDGNFLVVLKKYDGVSIAAMTTNASTTVTSGGLFVAGDVGRRISGPGIPIGATITAFTNSSTVTISAAATGTSSINAVVDRTDLTINAVNDFLAGRAANANTTSGWGTTTFDPNRALTTDSGILKLQEDLSTATLAISIDLDHSLATDQSVATPELRQINFGFAPPFRLTKTVSSPLVDEGDFFDYTIVLENRLPSVGVQGPTGCQYTAWATTGLNGTPDPQKAFANFTSAHDGPNRQVATATVTGGGLKFMTGTGFRLASQAGSVTKVEALYLGYFNVPLTDDYLNLEATYNASTVSTTIPTAAIDSYIGAPATLGPNSAISWDITATRPGGGAWTFADTFSTVSLYVNPSKAASADEKVFSLDAIGIRISTNVDCQAGASTTLNPVPLQDRFDTTSMFFVSAVPPPVSVSGGTIQWDNVGPILPGTSNTVTVTMRAADVGGLLTGTCTGVGISSISSLTRSGTLATVTTTAPHLLVSGQMVTVAGATSDAILWNGTFMVTVTGASTFTYTMTGTPAASPATGTLTLSAAPPSNSACNLAETAYANKNVYYSDGRKANDDAGKVPVSIQGKGELRGIVFRDLANMSGWPIETFPTDLPLADVSVTLFGCVKVDGVTLETGTSNTKDCSSLSTGNTWKALSTTTTASDGSYEFIGLDSGYYIIQVGDTDSTVTTAGVSPFGFTQTAEPLDAQTSASGNANGADCGTCNNTWGTSTVNLRSDQTTINFLNGASEETISGINFGYFSTEALIFGNIYHDKDGDGVVREPEDTDLSSFTVRLYTDPNGDGDPADGVLQSTTTSNSTGDYFFTVNPGVATNYTIVVTPATLPNNVWSETRESIGGTGSLDNRIPITVAPGSTSGSHDFGYTLSTTSTIGDTLFLDFDGDGVQDPTEAGIPNITVWLYSDLDRDGTIDAGVDTLLQTKVTDASGKYLFSGLAEGSYIVKVDKTDPDFPSGTTATADPDIYTGTIGDRLWIDADNGQDQDPGEDGLPGVTVLLWADNGNGTFNPGSDTLIAATLTNVNGNYLFTGLPAGSYFVQVDETTLPVGAALVRTTADPTATLITLPSNSSSYLTADSGYSPSSNFAIGNRIWHDVNGNGVQDAGEVGIPNVRLVITNGTPGDPCNPSCTVTTDASGHWYRAGLINTRTYTVDVTNADLPRDFVLTTGTDPRNVTLAGADVMTVDFAYRYTTPASSPTGTISGSVFLDADGDRFLDTTPVSEAMSGITVNLLDSNGYVIATTTTNGAGAYSFPGVFIGDYAVETLSSFGTRYSTVFLSSTSGFPNLNVIYDATKFTVADDQSSVSVDGIHSNLLQDFGYKRYLGSVGDTVYWDANENGTQDVGEPGFGGVTVRLRDCTWTDTNGNGVFEGDVDANTCTLVATTTTTADDPLTPGADEGGKYLFSNLDDLATGRYYVIEVDTTTLPGTYGAKGAGGVTTYLTADPETDGAVCTALTPSDPPATACENRNLVQVFRGGLNYLGGDFGYQITALPNYGKIGDFVWVDSDGDGIRDAGEPGIPAITVWIDTNNDGVVDTRTASVGTTNGSQTVTSAGLFTSADVGRQISGPGIPAGAYITGFTGINSVTISVAATATATVTATVKEAVTETDSDGYYLFAGLPDGSYRVRVRTADTDWPSGLPTTPTFEVRTSNTTGLDSIAVVTIAGGVVTVIDDGHAGNTDTCAVFGTCDLDTDFGYRYPGTNILRGTICAESELSGTTFGNCGATATTYSGVAAGTESALAGVTVSLYRWTDAGIPNSAWNGTTGVLDAADTFVLLGSTSTDVNGDYRFDNVPDNVIVVFGVNPTQNLRLDTTNANTSVEDGGVISRQVYDGYLDSDADGIKDPTEPTVIVRQALNLAGDADNDIFDLDFAFNATLSGTLIKDFGDLPDLPGTNPNGPTEYNATLLSSGASHRIRPTYSVGTTTGLTTVTSASFVASDVGSPIVGTGIPIGATITAVTPGVSATISAAATGTATVTASLGWFLGAGVTAEADGIASPTATGDVDDGIILVGNTMDVNTGGTIRATASGASWLVGWIDFNQDGDFADEGERILNQAVVAGTQDIPFTVALSGVSGSPAGSYTFFSRFRLYPSQPSLLAPTGAALNAGFQQVQGEVEDYAFTALVTRVTVTSFLARDMGGYPAIQWETSSEVGTVGFFLNRWDDREGRFVQINDKLLPSVQRAQGGKYSYIDSGASVRTTLGYELVEVEASGKRIVMGPYSVNTDVTMAHDLAVGRPNVLEPDHGPAGYLSAPHKGRRRGSDSGKAARAGSRASAGDRSSWRAPAERAKIGVRETGVHYVRAQDLADKAGLAIDKTWLTSNKNLYSLTIAGENVPFAASDDGQGLLFYGQKPASLFSPESVYWIGPSRGNAPRMMTRKDRPKRAPRGDESFARVLHAEKQVVAAPQIFENSDGDYWFWDYVFSGWSASNLTFRADGALGSGNASLTIRLRGGTKTEANPDHHAMIRLNGQYLGDVYWDGFDEVTSTFTVPSSVLIDGENTLQVEGLTDTEAPWSLFYVDFFDIEFQSLYRAHGNRFEGSTAGHGSILISGFTRSDIVVLDVSDPRVPVHVEGQIVSMAGGGFGVALSPARENTVYSAVAGDERFAATRITGDTPSSLRSSANQGEYLIITTREMMQAAQGLAGYRSDLRAQVVDIEDIYDEFNHGIANPHAVKAFLAYARANWATPPRYVVLAGDGTYDYQHVRQSPDWPNPFGEDITDDNLIPPMMVPTPNGLFPSDVWFADLDPSGAAPEIAIGRLPATTPAELAGLIEKIKVREASSGSPWLNHVLMASDRPDEAGDFRFSSQLIAGSLPPGSFVTPIDISTLGHAQARTALFDGINQGAGSIIYVGHGGYNVLSNDGLLWSSDLYYLTNSEWLPVMTAMTCLVGNFGLPGYPSLGEDLVTLEGGGLAALWGPTGMSENQFAVSLAEGYYAASAGPGTRIGDAILATMRAYEQTGGPNYMLAIYTLLGDPAMRLR